MAGDVSVETSPVGPIVRPTRPTETVVLYLHGDRQLAMNPVSAHRAAARLAVEAEAAVVCCGYRSAFPAALDDVEAGYEYCQSRGPVALAGERLGAGLAAALLLRLRDTGATAPRCSVLVSALLDLALETPSLSLNAATDPEFDLAEFRGRAARYAAGTSPTNPLLSPLYGNLHGLPPIQLLAAGNDPLLDDSLAFAARAARSGVTVDLRVRPDGAENLGSDATADMASFIRLWTPAAQPVHPA